MVAFSSLGQLGEYLAHASPAIELVDPGYPLGQAPDINAENVLRNQPSVRKVTSFIARNIASIPLHLYERLSNTDRARITDHPLAKPLSEPRPKVSEFVFWRDTWMDYLLHDRYAILFALDDRGDLMFTRLPANRMRIVGDEFGVTEIRYTNTQGKRVSLDPSVCVYESGYSPRGVNGLSPIDTLRNLLAESTEAVEYRRAVWRNGARIPQVVTRPQGVSWTDPARERFKSDMANFRKGGGAEGGIPVLEDGMEIKEVTSFRPRDTLDLEGRRLTDAEVASAYHIAPELVGAREGTYSNLEAFRQMLYRDSLGPWVTAREQALNVHLVPAFADGRNLYVESALEAKLRGSFEEQARVIQSSTGAPWLTRNEARARQNLPAVTGGDELVVPLNVLIGGQASPTDSAPTPKSIDEALRDPEFADYVIRGLRARGVLTPRVED